MARVTESQIALAVLQIASGEPDGIATFDRLREKIPKYLDLSSEDRAPSETREGEELWEQQIRNIKSHYKTEGNILCEGLAAHVPDAGYRITDAGRRHLKAS